jgi:nitrogen fixation protein FixH
VKNGMQWPIAVATILALTVAGNIYVAVRANDDPSVSAESDYYQKAVRFDADQALKRRSDRLGWRVALSAQASSGTQATVTAQLVDSTGAPVRGAVVRITARAVTRSDEPITGNAREDGDHYTATLGMARRGLWDLNVEAVRGGERFLADQRLELPALH